MAGLFLVGCGPAEVQKIGLLKSEEIPIAQLKTTEVPATLLAASDGIGFFQRNGCRAVYVVHPVPAGVRLVVKGVYGDPGKIVVEVAEVSTAAEREGEFEAPSEVVVSDSAALAALLPQVATADTRSVLVQYNPLGALYLGKELKTVEAICHPATAYSGVRYHFDPVDAQITAVLYVDKGPTLMGEKVLAMDLKAGETVMVTYVVNEEPTKPAEVVNVVRKPQVGMPGGPQ